MNHTIVLELDDTDFRAVTGAMERRRSFKADGKTIMPDDVESNEPGALVAEICRGWSEHIDRSLQTKN